MLVPGIGTLRALKFLFVGPFVLAICFVVNWMTFNGEWWVKWMALGIGIAWVVSALRVLRAVVIAGGLAAFVAYFAQKKRSTT